MKIVKNTNYEVELHLVDPGETFVVHNIYYIRTDCVDNDDVECVNLFSGEVVTFNSCDLVKPLKSELRIISE